MLFLDTSAALAWDHPRIRGTNRNKPQWTQQGKGSSPHTRDKCNPDGFPIAFGRIIPAYAGQILKDPLK